MFDEREPESMIDVQALRDLQRMTEEQRTTALRVVPRMPPRVQAETVVEFLRDLANRVERGEEDVSEGVVVHYLSSLGPKTSDGCKHKYWRYGLSVIQHLGLLQVGLNAVVHEDQ